MARDENNNRKSKGKAPPRRLRAAGVSDLCVGIRAAICFELYASGCEWLRVAASGGGGGHSSQAMTLDGWDQAVEEKEEEEVCVSFV